MTIFAGIKEFERDLIRETHIGRTSSRKSYRDRQHIRDKRLKAAKCRQPFLGEAALDAVANSTVQFRFLN